ncbi:MAG: hypothetical protein ACKOTZ_11780 [Chloroflexota bacterium]
MEATRAEAEEVALLAAQLERMRGMLGGYSAQFFAHMRVWSIVTIALLVATRWDPIAPGVAIVPFLVPFVFLEASYLFFYTVFARRHAAALERTLNDRLGRPVLHAHAIEAAYFYDPAAPKISALSLGRPLGHMSAMTVGYSLGAALLWLAGLLLTQGWVAALPGDPGLAGLLVPGAVAWTGAIVLYLLWTWLRRVDEGRLEDALRAAYPER